MRSVLTKEEKKKNWKSKTLADNRTWHVHFAEPLAAPATAQHSHGSSWASLSPTHTLSLHSPGRAVFLFDRNIFEVEAGLYGLLHHLLQHTAPL
jgi:hypothetical protein